MLENEVNEQRPEPELEPSSYALPPPPEEHPVHMHERYDAEFASWRSVNSERWIHCSRCDGFHKIAFVPRSGMCTSRRLEPEPRSVEPPPPLPPVEVQAFEADLSQADDEDDDDLPLKKGPGPKRNAKAEAAVWMQRRTHRFHTGR